MLRYHYGQYFDLLRLEGTTPSRLYAAPLSARSPFRTVIYLAHVHVQASFGRWGPCIRAFPSAETCAIAIKTSGISCSTRWRSIPLVRGYFSGSLTPSNGDMQVLPLISSMHNDLMLFTWLTRPIVGISWGSSSAVC